MISVFSLPEREIRKLLVRAATRALGGRVSETRYTL